MTSSKLIRFYDLVAPLYGFWSRVTESRAARLALEAAAIRRGESVLEVGIGAGALFCRLAKDAGGGKCVGIDLSWGMLRRARRRLEAERCPGLLCRGNACQLPFPAQTFDAVVSCYMLDILSEVDLEAALGEFSRATKPGGRLALVVMAQQARLLERIWMATYRFAPVLVGGCRPVNLVPDLAATGWRVETDKRISQNGFRSQLILARALSPEARAA